MQRLLLTGFHNRAVVAIGDYRAYPLFRSAAFGRQCYSSLRGLTVSRSAIAGNSLAVGFLKQSKDSWRLIDQQPIIEAVPKILLVDGTNLACLCAGGRHRSRSVFSERVEDRFASWLRFLQLYTQACIVLVAFDNKGSAAANVRAQLVPSYLRKRYKLSSSSSAAAAAAAAAGGGGDLNGWAHLGAVVRQLNEQQQQQQQQQQLSDCCYLVANAAYGYEADDVLAAATHWVSGHLQPRPLVVISSSDSDMQQLMDTHTYWLEMMQVPSKSHPSGLQLHSAAAFNAAAGYPPPLYADYLSLVGKPEASVQGLGVSAKLAKTLLQKVGCVDEIIAAGQAGGLKQFGPAADKLFSSSSSNSGSSSSSSERGVVNVQQQLLTNKGIFKLYGQQQVTQLPQQQMQACYAAATQTAGHHQQQQEGECNQTAAAAAAAGSSSAVAVQHPAISAHMRHSKPYLDQLSRCLQTLGLEHRVGCLTSSGHWCDIMVQVHGSSSSSSTECQQQQQQQWGPEPTSSSEWLAIQLLTPADLVNGPHMSVTLMSSSRNNSDSNSHSESYNRAADQLAQLLADRCGCFVQGNSALGHAKRRLLECATGAAKRRLSLLKGAGWKVAVVPFFELHLAAAQGPVAQHAAADGSAASSSSGAASLAIRGTAGARAIAADSLEGAMLDYVLALLQGQCGPTWKPPSPHHEQQQKQQKQIM